MYSVLIKEGFPLSFLHDLYDSHHTLLCCIHHPTPPSNMQGHSCWYSFTDGSNWCNLWDKHLWSFCPRQSQYTHPHCGWRIASGWDRRSPSTKDDQKDVTKVTRRDSFNGYNNYFFLFTLLTLHDIFFIVSCFCGHATKRMVNLNNYYGDLV